MAYKKKDECVNEDETTQIETVERPFGGSKASVLRHARSESYLKVEELLKTYRTYKNNKQEFSEPVSETNTTFFYK